jgi:anti-sigma factor RsiW
MTCDRETQVHAYHDRQLGPVGRQDLEDHLAECAACAQLLAELRAVSRLVSTATLPDVSAASADHYYAAWNVVRQQHGLLRISSWLTAAAAAVLVGSLVLWPSASNNVNTNTAVNEPSGSTWEAVAVMPPPERGGDRPDQFIELAQWMADDLSSEGIR